MAVRRDGNQSGSRKVRRRPASQGHPSQGRPTVGGGTKGKPTRYVSPTPTPPASQGHPSQGRPTVGGGTKGKPTRYVSPTTKRERAAERAFRRSRGSKAAKPKLSRRRRLDILQHYADRPTTYTERSWGTETPRTLGETAVKNPHTVGLKEVTAPAVKVLDQTTRLSEFVAGAADRNIGKLKKGDVVEALNAPANVKAGFDSAARKKGKRKRFSNVADTLGVEVAGEKAARKLGANKKDAKKAGEISKEVLGGVGDIAFDPITFVPGGAVGKLSAASRAARAATRAARRAGSPTTGKRVLEEATRGGKKAAKRKPVPRTPAARKVERRRRSAAARQAYDRSAQRSARIGVRRHQPSRRSAASKLFPVRPAEISATEWRKLEDASRRMRGTERSEALRAARKARSVRHVAKGERGRRRVLLRRPMKKEQSDRIRVAIERKTVHELPKTEQRAARRFQAETERELAMKRRAAIDAGERGSKSAKDGPVPRYRPHEPEGEVWYHGTDAETAAALRQNGGFTGRRRTVVWAGKKPELTKNYGPEAVQVHIKPERPLDVDGQEYPILAYGANVTEIEQRARAAGYDAIVRHGDDGWIKALKPSIVKVPTSQPEGYVPRIHTDKLPSRGPAARQIRRRLKRAGEEIRPGRERSGIRIGKRRTTTVKDRMRTDRRHWDELDEPIHVSDLETTLMASGQKAASFKATTEYRAAVRDMARPARNNAPVPPGHSVWVVRATEGERRFEKVPTGSPVPRDAIVLKDAIAEHANRQMLRREPLPFIDPVTNKIKWWLTIPNPQYWMRNAFGGLFNVWVEGTPMRKLIANLHGAASTTRGLGKSYKAEELGNKQPWLVDKGGRRVVERGTPREHEIRELGEKYIDLGKGGRVKVREFFREIEEENVAGGGMIQELIGAETMPRRGAQFFEDLPRMTAYLHYRRQGLEPAAASRKVQRSQFDYGNLTDFERDVMRRIFPFYTWRSRNLALMAESLVARPGKFATVEKTRDTAADVSGLPEDWQEKLTRSESFGLPFPTPLKFGGKKQLLYPALPITDLNLTAAAGNGDAGLILEQLAGSMNPIAKWPIEFFTNHSFYFKDDIERDYSRWTKAPAYAVKAYEATPGPLRELLHMDSIMRKDPKDGWQWRGKADYIANAIPPASMATGLLTQGETGRGVKKEQKAFGYLTGVRPSPFQPGKNRLNSLYDKKEELEQQRSDLSELHQEKKLGTNRYTARKAKLENEITRLEWMIHDLAKDLGESTTEPARRRDKRYVRGYDPENPPPKGVEDAKPLWGDDAPAPDTKKQRRARARQSQPDTAPLW